MQNSRSNTLVRGGQTSQHWMRMAAQALRYAMFIALLTGISVFLLLSAWFYELPKVRLTFSYWLAKYAVEGKGNEGQPIQLEMPDGTKTTRPALEIYLNEDYRALYDHYDAASRRFLWISLPWAIGAFFITGGVFVFVGRSLQAETYVRGARLVSARELNRWSRNAWRAHEKRFGKAHKSAPRYTLAGIEFPPNAVESQTSLTGTVGTGKTTAIHELLRTLRSYGGRAIIYDRNGTLVRDHFDPATDLILNPFDARSVGWTPFGEVSDPSQFAQIAEVLIPDEPNAHDPFWNQAARLVFEHAARRVMESGDLTNAALRRAILEMPADELEALVAQTPAQHFFGEDVSKTGASVRATMVSKLRFLEFLRDDAEPFSIRDWVIAGATCAEPKPGFIFLTGDAEHAAATRNVISTCMEVAANALMTCGECYDPRLWFFLDEVPTLNRLPFLPKSLATIRQFGGAFVLGYQVYAQLEEVYGTHGAQTIAGNLNNRVIFSTPDAGTAKRSSDALGEEDIVEVAENITLGANETRDGVGVMSRRVQRPIVTPARDPEPSPVCGLLQTGLRRAGRAD